MTVMGSSVGGALPAPSLGRKIGVVGGKFVALDHVDPEEKIPLLPQPFRMIDRIIRSMVEEALEQARDEKNDDDTVLPTLSPVFELENVKDATCLESTEDGLFMFIGTESGEIQVVNTLRGAVASKVPLAEEPVRGMAGALKGSWLASGAGQKLCLHMVVKSPPFLKPAHEIALKEQAEQVHLSEDGKVALAVTAAGALEAFTVAMPPPQLEEEDEEEDEEAAEAAIERKASEQPQELPAPVPVLLGESAVDAEGKPRRPEIFFCFSRKSREVGELPSQEVSHVLAIYYGISTFNKFALRPRPPEEEEPKAQAPEVVQRTPSPLSAAAVDSTSALLCTGMDNGTVVVWNNVFNTQHFTLKRHRARVTGSAFKDTSTPFPQLFTCAEDGVRVYDMKDGALLNTLSSALLSPRRLLPSEIPLAIVESGDGGMHLFNTESHALAASLVLPEGSVSLKTRSSTKLGEVLGVISEKKPPAGEEDDQEEGGEAEEGGEEPEAKRNETCVTAFRLIDMLKTAFPSIVKQQVSKFIQISARETYERDAMPQNPAVSDRFFRDAQQASQPGGPASKPPEFGSPRRASNSPRAMGSPKRGGGESSPMRGAGGGIGGGAPSPATNLRVRGLSGPPSAEGGKPGSARSRKSSSRAGSMSGGSVNQGLNALMQKEQLPSLAEKSVFDPVDAVMAELRVRAEEKVLRRVQRKKRTAELLASV